MSALSRLMPSLLRCVVADAQSELRRHRWRIVLAAVAALLAAMGLAMLAGGAFLLLAESMATAAAAAVTGGGLLAVAGLLALAAPRSLKPAGDATDSASAIADLVGAAAAAIDRDAHSETPRFALLAVLAGCAVGASPQLRRVIADLAR